MEIPQRLQIEGIKFVLVEKGGKRPFQIGWQDKIISFSNPELVTHLQNGGNYGVMGGGLKKLVIVDFDNEKVQEEVSKVLPPTFTVKSGRGLLHKYYFSDDCKSFKIFSENLDTLCDVQGEGKQVVGAGSLHPNGTHYELIDDRDIAFIPYAELKAIIMSYDRKPKKEEQQVLQERPTEYSKDNFLEEVKRRVRIEDVLNRLGVNISNNPSNCPFHDSKGGKCLGWKDETAHCFHCEGSWNIYSLIKEYKKCDFKTALEWLVNEFGLQAEHEASKQRYKQYLNSSEKEELDTIRNNFLEMISGKEKDISGATELLVNFLLNKNHIYTTKDDLKSEMWIYKEGIYVPQGKSELKEQLREILLKWFNMFYYNQVISKIEADTYIDADNFFKVNYSEEIAIQNGILDINTRELKEFTPEKIFFNKMPVIYNKDLTCPAIDCFLNDVLATEGDKQVFYEVGGFALMPEYLLEKAIMFVGGGRNGKGKTIELLKRCFGIENCAAVPLSNLESNSFQISELFGKRLNLAGDLSNSDLKETGTFKSLTGRDLVSGKRKFLRDINFVNNAKFVFACNDLPMVYDTSEGFWNRWILFNFPYTFKDKDEYDLLIDKTNIKLKDPKIIDKITTPEELSGLLNKFLDGYDRLKKNGTFSSSIGTEQIKELWIRKANSFMAFAMDKIEDDVEKRIPKNELRKRYSQYCKEHKLIGKSDIVVKRVLQELFGANEERVMIGSYPDNEQVYVWQGVKWKSQL